MIVLSFNLKCTVGCSSNLGSVTEEWARKRIYSTLLIVWIETGKVHINYHILQFSLRSSISWNRWFECYEKFVIRNYWMYHCLVRNSIEQGYSIKIPSSILITTLIWNPRRLHFKAKNPRNFQTYREYLIKSNNLKIKQSRFSYYFV